ncbi:MAG: hypothetical protein KKD24_05280 [Proteobacteria bacterium]|nr:hypothetical protein [Pseudomonadota bacterium]MBU4372782.1 hypothetical protein [Pseudomonadota bacterium]
MAEKSRVKFNPVTKEIEVEGSESFVKTTLDRLLAIISGAVKEKVKVKRATKAVKAAPAKKTEKKPRVVKAPRTKKVPKAPKVVKPAIAKRVRKIAAKAPAEKRVTNIDTIVSLIQGAPEGISTAELKEKTGLAESQIWNIINRATKLGKIRTVKRGLYGGAAAADASPEEKTE